MYNSFENLIGKNEAQYLKLIGELLFELENYKYTFMGQSEFEALMLKEPLNGNSQYIKEILYRANFSSLSALVRNYEWLMGMKSAYESQLYLPFASSFRCLIESVADSYHSIGNLAPTISKSIKHIDNALRAKSAELVLCEELENQLIHFTHARRLKSEENAPQTHKAKTASYYVRKTDEEAGSQFYDCYSELCQLSHPAAQGVLTMMLPVDEENFIFEWKLGREKISNLVDKYEGIMQQLFTLAFNPSIISLKVINKLKFEPLYVKGIDKFNLDHIASWKKCKLDIEKAGI
ncbi:hypothetical protein I6F50_05195 [Pseudoalteromonas sp. NZS127_1]|uniref:hypothetical protein n=1 Tax=Pseudoalteromonas sp. NZS127_1 TaxID=2792074 RepID=UPI0018CE0FC5|nr:hypothetical protein [Pseudoalteromonas sp. NZS127_1]MBG9994450.1 hypothetical protein [Pseudoalteromonas sp. NZS127_1]